MQDDLTISIQVCENHLTQTNVVMSVQYDSPPCVVMHRPVVKSLSCLTCYSCLPGCPIVY